MLKSFFAIFVCLILGFNAYTQKNELTLLPFDMVLGETPSEQIANFGQCERYENSAYEGPQKCTLYRINDGFVARVSARDKVTSLSFEVRYLPQNWKNIGFVPELSDEELTSLIRTLNAQNITTVMTGDQLSEIDFMIANYKYTASFSNHKFKVLKVAIAY